jgi:protein-tyrosine phosphatase
MAVANASLLAGRGRKNPAEYNRPPAACSARLPFCRVSIEPPRDAPRRLLFVCSGNICRSPLAEAVFHHLAKSEGAEDRFQVDSAGTHGWHEGELADSRARRVGARHGIHVDSVARPVKTSDFQSFDMILVMDRGHLREMRGRCPTAHRHKIHLLREYDAPGGEPDVPDPYYDGIEEFEIVFEIVSTCCRNLLAELRK